jgi:AcrR family transcriptional regulator
MTDELSSTTRQQILEAVIACIEKYGIANVTTRKIAEEAGTNIASINYYFRTKARLVDEALSMAVQNTLEDLSALIDQPDQSVAQILEEVCFFLIDGGLRFPGTTLAHLYTIMLEKRYDTVASHMFQEVLERLSQHAADEYPDKNQDEVRAVLAHILSAAMFSVLAPGLFLPLTTLDLAQPEGGRELARSLAQLFTNSLEK